MSVARLWPTRVDSPTVDREIDFSAISVARRTFLQGLPALSRSAGKYTSAPSFRQSPVAWSSAVLPRVAGYCQAVLSRESAAALSAAGSGCRYWGLGFQPGSGYSSVWPPLCFALSVDIRRAQMIPRRMAAHPPELLTRGQARTYDGPAQGERCRIRIRIKQRASTGRKGKMLDDC